MKEAFRFKEALAVEGPVATEQPAGRSTADICIVGGGYLGLWTAIRLKQADPPLNIAIVEKNICGSAASGSNGGIVASYWAQYLSLLKLAGPEGAAWIASRTADAVREQVEAFPVDPFPYLGAAGSMAAQGAAEGRGQPSGLGDAHPCRGSRRAAMYPGKRLELIH